MLHVTDDGGESWRQVYTTDRDGGFVTTGYSELCTRGLAFHPDGRLVSGNGDVGNFRSLDAGLGAFEYLIPEVDPSTAPGSDLSWAHESSKVHVRADWQGSGHDSLFAIHGDPINQHQATKLFRYDEATGWHDITASLDTRVMLMQDFALLDDDTVLFTYIAYDDCVACDGRRLDGAGVMVGRYDPGAGSWSWGERSDGLLFEDQDSGQQWNVVGSALLVHEPTGRVFLAAQDYVLSTSSANVSERLDVKGGLYLLDSAADSDWELVYGGPDTEWKDFRALASDADGAVLYAGTRGRATGWGAVHRCADPTAWEPMMHVDEGDTPFGFQVPFWAEGSWDAQDANRKLTAVRALAVAPWDPGVIFAGLATEGFMAQEGLWAYDLRGDGAWEQLSADAAFAGMDVAVLAFSPADERRLVVATGGQEMFTARVEADGVLRP